MRVKYIFTQKCPLSSKKVLHIHIFYDNMLMLVKAAVMLSGFSPTLFVD